MGVGASIDTAAAPAATTSSGTDVKQATPSEVLAPLRSKAEKTLNPLRETC